MRTRKVRNQNAYRVTSQRNPEKRYVTNLDQNTCTCPDYIFRQRRIGGDCKHIHEAKVRAEKRGK